MTSHSLRRRPAAAGDVLAPGNRLAWAVTGFVSLTGLAIVSAFLDERIAAAAITLPPGLIAFAAWMSVLGRSGYMFVAAGLVLLVALVPPRPGFDRWIAARTVLRERALYGIAVLAASGALAQVIKYAVGRARPRLLPGFGAYRFHPLSMDINYASFPSGHAATVFAMATALGLMLPRCRLPLFLLAGVIAVSRIMVEAHYLSDVVAGAALGVASAQVLARTLSGWSIGFDRDAGSLRLKGAGLLWRSVRGGAP